MAKLSQLALSEHYSAGFGRKNPYVTIDRAIKLAQSSAAAVIVTHEFHSVAEAKDRLPELITRALGVEAVAITLNGRPAMELKPVSLPRHPVTPAEFDRLPSAAGSTDYRSPTMPVRL